jgi:hypothetical protein
MASRRNRILYHFDRAGTLLQPSKTGGLNVDWTTLLAFVLSIVLGAYLAAALLVPEKFS